MKINFEIAKEDYINFNIYHLENSKAQKKTFNTHRYIMPLIFSIPLYCIAVSSLEKSRIYGITVAIIFSVVWILRYPKRYKKIIAKSVDKNLSEGDNSSIFGKKSLEIIDETLVIKGDSISETVLIESIKEIKVYKDMILIYISGFAAHIIPRRYLDEDTEKRFIEQLRRQMSPKS